MSVQGSGKLTLASAQSWREGGSGLFSLLSHRPLSPRAGCFRRWNEDGSSACVKCANETEAATQVYNLTGCPNGKRPSPLPGPSCLAMWRVAPKVRGILAIAPE